VDRHGFDVLSFVFGAALAGVGVLLIAGVGEVLVTGSWIGPLAAILIGILIVVAAPRPARRARDTSSGEEVAEADA
jgi:riboflavin transporter FmnP